MSHSDPESGHSTGSGDELTDGSTPRPTPYRSLPPTTHDQIQNQHQGHPTSSSVFPPDTSSSSSSTDTHIRQGSDSDLQSSAVVRHSNMGPQSTSSLFSSRNIYHNYDGGEGFYDGIIPSILGGIAPARSSNSSSAPAPHPDPNPQAPQPPNDGEHQHHQQPPQNQQTHPSSSLPQPQDATMLMMMDFDADSSSVSDLFQLPPFLEPGPSDMSSYQGAIERSWLLDSRDRPMSFDGVSDIFGDVRPSDLWANPELDPSRASGGDGGSSSSSGEDGQGANSNGQDRGVLTSQSNAAGTASTGTHNREQNVLHAPQPPPPPSTSMAGSAPLSQSTTAAPTRPTSGMRHHGNVSVAQPSLAPTFPLYSATGFDLLSILARVALRPRPQVRLGPIDMSTAFTVVDFRKHDHPIVYCSPSFCNLTGYPEEEVIGKNCRFLQSPLGDAVQGDARLYTNSDEVAKISRTLTLGKEMQANIINYRKDGNAFVNHLTVVPIYGGRSQDGDDTDGEDAIAYYVGFQVDLNAQPAEIMRRLEKGTYKAKDAVDVMFLPHEIERISLSGSGAAIPVPIVHPAAVSLGLSAAARRGHAITNDSISRPLRTLLSNQPGFVSSFFPGGHNQAAEKDTSHALSQILLSHSALPDCIMVLSLKGGFSYVSDNIKSLLGYDASELVNKGLVDVCHPADVVPLLRELKDTATTSHPNPLSAATASPTSSTTAKAGAEASTSQPPPPPKAVDLLFRAKTKDGRFVWMECRGRLYVEPGKSRKAIVMSARVRDMVSLRWSDVLLGSGSGGRGEESGLMFGGSRLRSESTATTATLASDADGDGDGDVELRDSDVVDVTITQDVVEDIDSEREVWVTLSYEGVVLAMGPEERVTKLLGYDVMAASSPLASLGSASTLYSSAPATASSASSSLIAVGEEILIGKRMEELVPGQDDKNALITAIASVSTSVRFTTRLQRKDGGVVDVKAALYRTQVVADGVGGDQDSGRERVRRQPAQPLIMHIYPLPASLSSSNSSSSSNDSNILAMLPTSPASATFPSSSAHLDPSRRQDTMHAGTDADVFKDLAAVSGTSWQYEIQQMRRRNTYLLEECRKLEAAIAASGRTVPAGPPPGWSKERERQRYRAGSGSGSGSTTDVSEVGGQRTRAGSGSSMSGPGTRTTASMGYSSMSSPVDTGFIGSSSAYGMGVYGSRGDEERYFSALSPSGSSRPIAVPGSSGNTSSFRRSSSSLPGSYTNPGHLPPSSSTSGTGQHPLSQVHTHHGSQSQSNLPSYMSQQQQHQTQLYPHQNPHVPHHLHPYSTQNRQFSSSAGHLPQSHQHQHQQHQQQGSDQPSSAFHQASSLASRPTSVPYGGGGGVGGGPPVWGGGQGAGSEMSGVRHTQLVSHQGATGYEMQETQQMQQHQRQAQTHTHPSSRTMHRREQSRGF